MMFDSVIYIAFNTIVLFNDSTHRMNIFKDQIPQGPGLRRYCNPNLKLYSKFCMLSQNYKHLFLK